MKDKGFVDYDFIVVYIGKINIVYGDCDIVVDLDFVFCSIVVILCFVLVF